MDKLNHEECKFLKLRDWIDIDKINWYYLTKNPNAIHL
jgi:hypothetical protein